MADEENNVVEQIAENAGETVETVIENAVEQIEDELEAAEERAEHAEQVNQLLTEAALEGERGRMIAEMQQEISTWQADREKINRMETTLATISGQMEALLSTQSIQHQSPLPASETMQEPEPTLEAEILEPEESAADQQEAEAEANDEPEPEAPRRRKRRWI